MLPISKYIYSSRRVDLSSYTNIWYSPQASFLKRMMWFIFNSLFFINPLFPLSAVKVILLRAFGAKVGKGVIIKPSVNIKYPWLLEIGNYVWIGERVWIDNLTWVKISDNVCLSQESMLLTGNHDYTKATFDLLVKEIVLQEGVWIGAKAVVCPGVICHSHSILAVNSVATRSLEAHWIYQGNPAEKRRERIIK